MKTGTLEVLNRLSETLLARRNADPSTSYTASLLAKGPDAILKKIGEESGNEQLVRAIRTDCDGDALLLLVEQQGGIACHTGRQSCFFYSLIGEQWHAVEPVLRDPKEMYQ